MRLPSIAEPIAAGNAVNWDAPLNRGLVGSWLALPGGGRGNTFFDLCRRNHGTLTNGPSWSGHNRPGGWGALSLDGSDDYVRVGNVAPLSITGALTIALWVKGAGNQLNKALVGKYDSIAGQRGYLLHIEDSAGSQRVVWLYQRAADVFNSEDRIISAANVMTGDWRHVVCTFEPSTAARMYLDGTLDSSDTTDIQASIASNTASFDIGRHSAGFHPAVSIDDVRVYDRALADDEVWRLYDASRSGYPRELNRVRRFWFVGQLASGAIAGSCTLGFTTAGDLHGDAAAAGTSDITFSTTADLDAEATATGTSDITFTTAGNLLSEGGMTGTTTLDFTTAGDLDGDAAAAGTTTITFDLAGVLTGDGSATSPIAGTATLDLTTAGVLLGEGAMIGLAAFAFSVTGHGSVTVFGPPIVEQMYVFTPGLEAVEVFTPGLEAVDIH